MNEALPAMARDPVTGSVAIFGAGGFIGTNLRRALLADGYGVRAMSRSWLSAPEEEIDLTLTADVDHRPSVERVLEGADCAVVLSHGLLPGSELHAAGEGMLKSLATVLHLTETCERQGIRLIYLSSGGTVYGRDVQVPTPEHAACNPINLYGVSKLVAELVLSVHSGSGSLDHIALRVSNPYGPWQVGRNGQGVIGAWLARAARSEEIEVWGDGSIVRDYVYIDDVVAAVIAAIKYSGSERIFNIGSGVGESLDRILQVIETIRPTTVRYRTARPVDVPVSVLDASRAARELGWRASTTLDDGIRRTWEWMQKLSSGRG